MLLYSSSYYYNYKVYYIQSSSSIIMSDIPLCSQVKEQLLALRLLVLGLLVYLTASGLLVYL